MHTQEQIEARAKEIGARNYHPIPHYFTPDSCYEKGYAVPGISIRQELMRTAMGGLDLDIYHRSGSNWIKWVSKDVAELTNALLIQMAKDELGV